MYVPRLAYLLASPLFLLSSTVLLFVTKATS
jgi:hypothetical protein